MGFEQPQNSENAERPFEIAKKLSEQVHLFEACLDFRDKNGFSVLLDDTNRAIFQASLEQIDLLSLSEEMDPEEINKAMNALAESLYYFGKNDRGGSLAEDLNNLNQLNQYLVEIADMLTKLKKGLEITDATKYESSIKFILEITDVIIPDRLGFINRYYQAVSNI